jgi:hypothetical protein
MSSPNFFKQHQNDSTALADIEFIRVKQMPYQRWIKGFVSGRPDKGARGLWG